MVLTELKTNRWAKILTINLPWETRKCLMEIGILPKTEVKLICKNPFANVLLIQMGESHIALSEKLAKNIKIQEKK